MIQLIFSGVVVIAAHHQNTRGLQFKVPLVPYIPALSIICNIELMVHLCALTWLRFFIWIAIGMLVYFLYGIHHSKEGESGTSYSMLMTSSEATKGHWGSTGVAAGTAPSKVKIVTKYVKEDKKPIINEEERP